jgi:hypothetical protein
MKTLHDVDHIQATRGDRRDPHPGHVVDDGTGHHVLVAKL